MADGGLSMRDTRGGALIGVVKPGGIMMTELREGEGFDDAFNHVAVNLVVQAYIVSYESNDLFPSGSPPPPLLLWVLS